MSGGGSSSVEYMDYIVDWHNEQLNLCKTDMLSARSNNPYSGESAYDPSGVISEMDNALNDYDPDDYTWASLFTAALAVIPDGSDLQSLIDDEVDAFTDDHNAERTNVILPRFKAGMVDMNAVMTSAFVVGQSIIESYGARDVERFDYQLTREAFLQAEALKVERYRIAGAGASQLPPEMVAKEKILHYSLEKARMEIASERDSIMDQLEIDVGEQTWRLSSYQTGANLLASVAGGTSVTDPRPNKTVSAIGGALQGAAAGGQYGGWYGAAAGAVIGGVGGYLYGK